MDDQFELGQQAFHDGKALTDNPNPMDGDEFDEWFNGWQAADECADEL